MLLLKKLRNQYKTRVLHRRMITLKNIKSKDQILETRKKFGIDPHIHIKSKFNPEIQKTSHISHGSCNCILCRLAAEEHSMQMELKKLLRLKYNIEKLTKLREIVADNNPRGYEFPGFTSLEDVIKSFKFSREFEMNIPVVLSTEDSLQKSLRNWVAKEIVIIVSEIHTAIKEWKAEQIENFKKLGKNYKDIQNISESIVNLHTIWEKDRENFPYPHHIGILLDLKKFKQETIIPKTKKEKKYFLTDQNYTEEGRQYWLITNSIQSIHRQIEKKRNTRLYLKQKAFVV